MHAFIDALNYVTVLALDYTLLLNRNVPAHMCTYFIHILDVVAHWKKTTRKRTNHRHPSGRETGKKLKLAESDCFAEIKTLQSVSEKENFIAILGLRLHTSVNNTEAELRMKLIVDSVTQMKNCGNVRE